MLVVIRGAQGPGGPGIHARPRRWHLSVSLADLAPPGCPLGARARPQLSAPSSQSFSTEREAAVRHLLGTYLEGALPSHVSLCGGRLQGVGALHSLWRLALGALLLLGPGRTTLCPATCLSPHLAFLSLGPASTAGGCFGVTACHTGRPQCPRAQVSPCTGWGALLPGTGPED